VNSDVAVAQNLTAPGQDNDKTRAQTDIYRAQIQALYQQIPMVLSLDVVNASLVAIVLLPKLDSHRWFSFLVLIIILVGIRAVGWHFFRTGKISNSTAKWAIWAIIGSALSGILWGGGSVLLLPANLADQTFIAFVIGGMCTAPLVSFSYYLPAFLAYVIPAVLPLAGRFVLSNFSTNVVMGDMILVFAVAITLAAFNSNRAFKNLLLLNFDLTVRTKELSAINILIQTEITQRKATEAQLHQAQKMEAIGQLTGGIAHDFNNLLTGVIGHLDLACRRAVNDPRTTALLEGARHAAERGATLTRQLLAFSRSQHLDARPVDVSAVVDGVRKMIERTIGPNIRLVLKAEPDLAPAWVDPNQLELAILNLALNARDAMPEGGSLWIDAQNRIAETECFLGELASGKYVVVSVTDTGAGMDEETLARSCEPFFTTKEAGRGSGLGLSMVHGFAAQSGGSVLITSVVGKGTRVDLWLPCADSGTAETDTMEVDTSTRESHRATILVCDDDDDVRTFVVDMLRERGFTILEASGVSSALEIIQRELPIDLLLVDYAMPEMNGLAVIHRAQACCPELKALLMTGHAEILRTSGDGVIPLLAKPFKGADLERRIEEVLSCPIPVPVSPA